MQCNVHGEDKLPPSRRLRGRQKDWRQICTRTRSSVDSSTGSYAMSAHDDTFVCLTRVFDLRIKKIEAQSASLPGGASSVHTKGHATPWRTPTPIGVSPSAELYTF